ncbi:E3 SUMO-protein ligase PIAS4b isoform X2 [Alosa alosa]|uniref:E3 SUMO-protein ligase PIAS4b isoform X2 n=1 Tax=Alosa alosa TaxID=278164 RepID=UPI002015490D|nr:E3 SUMO-protein ligase PIAS4b isoform X2 [Alosa alosa]
MRWQSMVQSFRVVDLRALFLALGKDRKGLKKDLIRRAIQLIENESSQELITKIYDIYNSRHQPQAVSSSYWNIGNNINTLSSRESDIKLKAYPFHETLGTLIDLQPLRPKNLLQNLQLQLFTLILSEEQRKQLIKLRSSGGEVQIVIRICYTESVGVEDDQYPSNLIIAMNHISSPPAIKIQVRKLGEEPMRPCPPINITSHLDLNKASHVGYILWYNTFKSYSFAVYLVRVLSVEELVAQLRKSSVESVESCRTGIREKMITGQDSEVATTGLRVSLLCPLVKTRLRVPCRGFACAHLQCFDALTYLELNRQKPTWLCPVCDRHSPFSHLRIDGLLSSILVTAEESVEEIEFLEDGSWCSGKDQHGNAHRTDLSVSSLASFPEGEVIDLTQDSDEEF